MTCGALPWLYRLYFFKFLKLRLELRINSCSCLCQWQQTVFLSRTFGNTQKSDEHCIWLFGMYLCVRLCRECVIENTCKFLGVAKLRILGLLIHTYFHHWIEICGGGRRMLFKAHFFRCERMSVRVMATYQKSVSCFT